MDMVYAFILFKDDVQIFYPFTWYYNSEGKYIRLNAFYVLYDLKQTVLEVEFGYYYLYIGYGVIHLVSDSCIYVRGNYVIRSRSAS